MSECKAHRKNSFMPFSCENVELPIHATNVVFIRDRTMTTCIWNDIYRYISISIYIYIPRFLHEIVENLQK